MSSHSFRIFLAAVLQREVFHRTLSLQQICGVLYRKKKEFFYFYTFLSAEWANCVHTSKYASCCVLTQRGPNIVWATVGTSHSTAVGMQPKSSSSTLEIWAQKHQSCCRIVLWNAPFLPTEDSADVCEGFSVFHIIVVLKIKVKGKLTLL